MVKNSSRGWLRVRGEAVCASLRGMLFEPCFHFEKTDDRSFRGSLSGLGFAYCDFTRRDITLPIVQSAPCGEPPSEPRCPRRSGASVSTTEKPRATKLATSIIRGNAGWETSISGRGNGRYIRLDPWSWLSLHRAQASGADRRRACPATDDIPALA